MEATTGLVAGSHSRNELIVIQGHLGRKPFKDLSGQMCDICGDHVGETTDGDLFVACNECGFPVCRPCYEYERREGSQLCPHCKTRYKRLKGSPRVEGDEDEENVDDIDHEFNNVDNNKQPISGEPPMMSSSLLKRVHFYTVPEPGRDEKEEGGWAKRMDEWKLQQSNLGPETYHSANPEAAKVDAVRQPLSRKLPIASSKINPYRIMVVARLFVLAIFLWYRILNPVHGSIGLWLTSVICEIWFSFSWILDQLPKWTPIDRETYLDRLSLRYEREGEPNMLPHVDIFVNTVDPMKEPVLVTANTALSILAMDYPVDKLSCYVSDDGASIITFQAMTETAKFAKSWVPFCKKFLIEPRAPEMYFSLKIDYLKDKVQPSFVQERRTMKREYEEFKVRINGLVAKAVKVPPEGWIMQDGTPWPGNNPRDHPGMIQVFLGHSGGVDTEGNVLPRLIYVSREKRPGFQHKNKAGSMNALIRVSGVLTNAPFILNLDCDHYVNNSKAIREAMCFLMDPQVGKRVCYVQFPQRFDGIDKHDRYANRNTVFYDINMKGLDGIQGPIYVGTGCVFRRRALYGYEPPKSSKCPKMVTCDCCPCFGRRKKLLQNSNKSANEDGGIAQGLDIDKEPLMSQMNFEKRFGPSSVFVSSALMIDGGVAPSSSPAALLEEAINVIKCGYEDKTEWGYEVGWIYGSITEDILTGFKLHCRGWRSIYCMPKRPAFKGLAPINLSDRLNQVFCCSLGSIEIFFSHHSPVRYGVRRGKLKWLERFAYINTIVYPFISIPLLAYCLLPAICLFTDTFILPEISSLASIFFIALFITVVATCILELRWSGVSIEEWWRNEQFWVISGISAHLLAVVRAPLKIFARTDTNIMIIISKATNGEDFGGLYTFKWTTLLIPPTTILIINLVGVVVGISNAISNGYQLWGPLLGKLIFAFWVIVHLYPFLKGLMGRQHRTPTIVVIWSVLLASVFVLLWVRIDPFSVRTKGPDVNQCGLNC